MSAYRKRSTVIMAWSKFNSHEEPTPPYGLNTQTLVNVAHRRPLNIPSSPRDAMKMSNLINWLRASKVLVLDFYRYMR